jgi:flotillin
MTSYLTSQSQIPLFLGFDPFTGNVMAIVAAGGAALIILIFYIALTCYRKVEQGQAIIRNGMGGTPVSFGGMFVFPIIHRAEMMDISVKRIEIDRSGMNGLICKDNIRADIKVAFFVRVNKTEADVSHVAQAVGCGRASHILEITQLFDAKFSEALKTAGKRFDFTELYDQRDHFRDEIVKIIGTNLNGFVLDDTSIDYLEQTPLAKHNPDNILDAEGIKKINELTATQAKMSNQIQRDKERVIRQQDVETAEAVLELDRQLAETTAKQMREVQAVQARAAAEAEKVVQQERLKSEQARIATEEEIAVLMQNKERQIIVAQRSKEKTDLVEQERVKREQGLEAIDRERVITLKGIEKEKAVEIEKKAIQDVIRERVTVEKTVVIEQQKIKDTEAFATADREKQVALTAAEKTAQERLIQSIKQAEADKESGRLLADQQAYTQTTAAEAGRKSAELEAQRRVILADAEQEAATKEAAGMIALAGALQKESAARGLGEAEVVRATTAAEADGIRARTGAEAEGLRARGLADAEGIKQKAEAMRLFENAGQAHEEFKLRLDKERAVELAQIAIQKDIAAQQAAVIGEALKSAKIDIVGGESTFFDRITQAITTGKVIDRTVANSQTLSDVKDTFFNGDPEFFRTQFQNWTSQFGVTSEDVKNLTVAAAIGKLIQASPDGRSTGLLSDLLATAQRAGLAGGPAAALLKGGK